MATAASLEAASRRAGVKLERTEIEDLLAPSPTETRFFRMTTDPVCGMDLEESQAKASAEFEGKTYYFCSDACREEFEASPEQYALGAGSGASASP